MCKPPQSSGISTDSLQDQGALRNAIAKLESKLESRSSHSLPNVVTSVPAFAPYGGDRASYEAWFVRMVRLCIQKTVSGGYTIFCQTDLVLDGELVDTSYLVIKGLEEEIAVLTAGT